MNLENLLLERLGEGGAIARVTVNRPKALNALDPRTMEELQAVMSDLSADASARVVIVTGAGEKAFVAGADIKGMIDFTPEQAQRFSEVGHRLGDTMAAMPQIVIAMVNGFALGGGCELALACDFIYAASTARFGQPEVNLGVIPGFGGTTRLARRVGVGQAIELATTGEIISAELALRIGLVNRVFAPEDLEKAVMATAEAIVKKGPLAVAKVKRSVRASLEVSLSEQNRLEARLFGECFATADQKEGMSAFVEKRPPAFRGA